MFPKWKHGEKADVNWSLESFFCILNEYVIWVVLDIGINAKCCLQNNIQCVQAKKADSIGCLTYSKKYEKGSCLP